MMSKPGKETIATNILPNTLTSKGYKAIKLVS